jgi:hypothetical protein
MKKIPETPEEARKFITQVRERIRKDHERIVQSRNTFEHNETMMKRNLQRMEFLLTRLEKRAEEDWTIVRDFLKDSDE